MADSLAAVVPAETAIGLPTATARRLVNASLSDNTRRACAGALHQLDAWLDGRRLEDNAVVAYLPRRRLVRVQPRHVLDHRGHQRVPLRACQRQPLCQRRPLFRRAARVERPRQTPHDNPLDICLRPALLHPLDAVRQ